MSGMSVEQKSSEVSDDDFLQLTEEEKVEWAKQHSIRERAKQTTSTAHAMKAKKLKAVMKDRKKKKRKYQAGRSKLQGNGYKEKRYYLYHYNEEYRQLVLYRKALYDMRQRTQKLTNWWRDYHVKYKKHLEDYANTYVINEELEFYDLGFSLKTLANVAPFGVTLLKKLVVLEILPPPIKKGKMILKNKVAQEPTEYYTVQEVRIILSIFIRYWYKYHSVGNPEQQQWLKKQFWTKLTEYRND